MVEQTAQAQSSTKLVQKLDEHIIEIVSDSGEGAQTAGQMFGTLAAKSGNSVWTVEIIPAEIEPPVRVAAGASGNRIRLGSFAVNNAGDEADIVIGFNEQVLMGGMSVGKFKPSCRILLENVWATHSDPAIVQEYTEMVTRLRGEGYQLYEIPMEKECMKYVQDPRRGKNMFVVGMLCSIYSQDMEQARREIRNRFRKKGEKLIKPNIDLLEAGYQWAEENLDFKFEIPPYVVTEPQIVTNGNTAIALGVIASGMEVCSMYPITPATSASHYLSEIFTEVSPATGTVSPVFSL